MNDEHEPHPDELLDDTVELVRAVTPPDAVRAANRATVRRALALRARPPWWRRTLVVPIPVAIAAMVLLALTTAASLQSGVTTRRDKQTPRALQSEIMADAAPDLGAANTPDPSWSVTRSYIHSLGSLARVRVTLPAEETEKQNDF